MSFTGPSACSDAFFFVSGPFSSVPAEESAAVFPPSSEPPPLADSAAIRTTRPSAPAQPRPATFRKRPFLRGGGGGVPGKPYPGGCGYGY
ncbi:hypothetical protein [Streptomyces pseudogriseolus]|uniref:hypothetical protein n=1 Tax=Streptomyces pseudogriseolus TaxID=36817 RepID=UPI003FA29FB3